MSHLSSSLVARNHQLEHLFASKEIIMKGKPKAKKNDEESDDEDDIGDAGYKDIPTVGVN